MARNILSTQDAIDRAEGVNQGLDALISLLSSASQDDMPSGQSISELLWSLQQSMAQHLADARAGLVNVK